MSNGIFFNYWGRTHELSLCLYDRPTVWRAIIDNEDEVFFEADTNADIIDLIELAIGAWVADGQ